MGSDRIATLLTANEGAWRKLSSRKHLSWHLPLAYLFNVFVACSLDLVHRDTRSIHESRRVLDVVGIAETRERPLLSAGWAHPHADVGCRSLASGALGRWPKDSSELLESRRTARSRPKHTRSRWCGSLGRLLLSLCCDLRRSCTPGQRPVHLNVRGAA